MTEFFRQDLSGARFEEVDFTRAWFRNVYFVGATLRGAWLEDVDIDGEIRNVRINGVDVGPFVEAELDRRHPERTKLRPTDADGFREAWAVIEQAWPSTVERRRRLPPELLHERVDDEWSFVATLRHLLFATDAWLLLAFLGRSTRTRRWTCRTPRWNRTRACPRIPTRGRPLTRCSSYGPSGWRSCATRWLPSPTTSWRARPIQIFAPGYPAAGTCPVSRCLNAVISEEWLHRLYAERDLAVLKARRTGTAG